MRFVSGRGLCQACVSREVFYGRKVSVNDGWASPRHSVRNTLLGVDVGA